MLNLSELGPLYGPIHANGLPVLGVPILPDFAKGEVKEEDWPLQILPPGPFNVSCIEFSGGGVFAKGIHEEGNFLPGAWDYDDVAVVMALLYGDPTQKYAPGFDMYFEGDELKKVWTPHWLAATNFGKSMFCCFDWLRGLVLFPEHVYIQPKDECLRPEYHDIAVNLIEGLKRFKDVFELSDNDKFLIKPDTMHVDLVEESAKDALNTKDYLLHINDFTMKTEVIRLSNGHYVSDEEASYGLNQMYGDIEYLLPVFRRAACITALYVGMEHLSRKDYKFRDDIRNNIEQDYKAMAANTLPL